jgi:RES domain-containing protein
MRVFRISLSKWSNKLTASGFPGRWNSKGKFVIYTAGSRALACLENVVHRSGEGLNNNFKVMVIEIPSKVKITEIRKKELPKGWYKYKSYSKCQKIGDTWIMDQETAVLKIPSSIISKEYNYLINTSHKDFRYIKLIEIENFDFDPRIKGE